MINTLVLKNKTVYKPSIEDSLTHFCLQAVLFCCCTSSFVLGVLMGQKYAPVQ